jgi:hypothetical protein
MTKTFEECLKEAEDKFSRKADGKNNTDSLYPILMTIVKEGTKEWLTQKRREKNRNKCLCENCIFTRLETFDELLEELQK